MARGVVSYTDGSPVQAGDAIRYRQAPGGMLPPGQWTYGVAVLDHGQRHPCLADGEPDLILRSGSGRHHGLLGHVIERV